MSERPVKFDEKSDAMKEFHQKAAEMRSTRSSILKEIGNHNASEYQKALAQEHLDKMVK